MISYRSLPLFLSVGAVVLLALFKLNNNFPGLVIQESPVPSLKSLIGVSDALREGTSSLGLTSKSSVGEIIGQQQFRTAQEIATQMAVPKASSAGVHTPGVITSASTSIVRTPLGNAHCETDHKSESATSSTKRSKSLLVTRMPKWFNRTLAQYPAVPTENVHRVIIITYFRAGSSFIGEMLSSAPRTFYHFEPLRMFSGNFRIDTKTLPNALDIIGHLFRCEFKSIEHYARWDHENNLFFKQNHFLWALCRGHFPVCFNSDVVYKVCSRAPAQVMKVTRLHMSQVYDWLSMDPDIARSVKILHLVRDPRGIVASRRRVAFCNRTKSCMHQDTVCSEIRADLASYEMLKKMLPHNIYRLRFEDFCLDPRRKALELFEVLGLNYTDEVTTFLSSHTKARKDQIHPRSTWRNTPTVASHWKTKLSYEDVVDIQRSCYDVLLRLGYKIITSANEMNNEEPVVTGPS